MKEQVRTDEQFQAMTSRFQIREPQLFCQGQKRISLICINPQCEKLALMCSDLQCKTCGKKEHFDCFMSSLHATTNRLNQISNSQKQFFYKVWSIQNELIEAINQSRKKLPEKFHFGDLQQNYVKIVDEIYRNKNVKCLKGKQAKSFCQRLKKNSVKNKHIFLQKYKESIKIIMNDIIGLKEKLYQSLLQVKQSKANQNFAVDSLILSNPLSTNIQQMKNYDSFFVKYSKSLIDELMAEQKEFLSRSLNYPKKIQLLYRASNEGFTAANFHKKCDNVPNTLTIVRTQYGKTIGGFTQYAWNSASNTFYSQAGKNAFLLSFDLKEKLLPINQNNLIYCHASYGPTFGAGHDLYLSDACHNNRSSHANFPTQYNKQGENKYEKNQETYKLFSGATSGYSFRVVQYEVFRVLY